MASEKYIEQSVNLVKAIDIVIKVIKENPPNGFNDKHVEIFLETYYRVKNNIINADRKFQTVSSLKHDVQVVFTYFNEGAGEAVNEFWKKIKESNLPYERENKLEKILLKRKIRNLQEYDYIIDTMVPFKQEGLISEADFQILNQLIEEYERTKGR